MLYHPQTGQSFTSHQAAQAQLKQLAPNLVKPSVPPMPEVGPKEKAVLGRTPVDLGGGNWGLQWSVVPMTAEEFQETLSPLTRTQFAKSCRRLGVINATEAEEWAAGNAMPQVAIDALALIPDADERTDARIDFASATTIRRDSPFLPLLASVVGLNTDQVDEIFTLGATL